MRTGQATQGAIGLHWTGLSDESQPRLNVRSMGTDEMPNPLRSSP